MWKKPSRYREDRDECFAVIYKIFVKFGHHKIKKIITVLCLLIQFLFYLLLLYYIIIKFNKNLVLRYSCTTISSLYVFYSAIFDTTYKNENREDQFQNFAWSLDSAGTEVKDTILKRSKKTNRILYLLMLFVCLAVVINSPMLSDQRELFLCTQVFEYFFGKWSQILSIIYFTTMLVLCFGSFQLSFITLYVIQQLQVQIILLNQRILQMENNFNRLDDWDKTYSVQYQKEIKENLQLTTEQHSAILRYVKNRCKDLEIAMPVLLFLGTLSTLSIYFFVLNNFFDNSCIVKIRILFILLINISTSTMYAKCGQGIVDETERIFDALASCQWYNWNLKNRKTLLVCMANSIKTVSYNFAGITVDYKMAVGMARFSFSYALTLYQLNNAK